LADSNGDLYRNYLTFNINDGVALGEDSMNGCGFSTSPTLIGFASSNPQLAQHGVVTSGVDLADNFADWQAQGYTGGQEVWHVALTCNTQNKSGKYKGKFG
jgi:hypothetical protein